MATLEELTRELADLRVQVGHIDELAPGDQERLLNRLEMMRGQLELARKEASGAVDLAQAELAQALAEEGRERSP